MCVVTPRETAQATRSDREEPAVLHQQREFRFSFFLEFLIRPLDTKRCHEIFFMFFFEIPNPTSGRQTKSDPTSGRKTKSYRRRRHEEEGDGREEKTKRRNKDVMNECSCIVTLMVLEVSPGGPPDVPSRTPRKPPRWLRGLAGPKIVKF